MRYLPAALAVLASLWPVLLGAALVDEASAQPGVTSAVVYTAASRICHQRPERSFRTHGRSWPVCGRCAGLYLAAPIGAWLALAGRRRATNRSLVLLAIATIPTAGTVVLEWTVPGVVTSVARAAAAIPLGSALAYVLVSTAGAAESIE